MRKRILIGLKRKLHYAICVISSWILKVIRRLCATPYGFPQLKTTDSTYYFSFSIEEHAQFVWPDSPAHRRPRNRQAAASDALKERERFGNQTPTGPEAAECRPLIIKMHEQQSVVSLMFPP
ncbi:hypothetical protein D4764_08G0002330 [Takifugu flavidus]|uniref:Uncharacterized protein n=1 Tax=Takifugu flavidus TaxID=433684 RepID=A0A5C6MM69_9TELE|nr:hypothetical protein D4764_08G0002330 [Takifugu flavidus]